MSIPEPDSSVAGAVIEGDYRYLLWRRVAGALIPARPICWLMLNPSTADGAEDDPTIRRVVNYSKAWGYTMVEVVNLFALRATDPTELLFKVDPVGPTNDQHVLASARRCATIVAAWGSPQQMKLGRMTAARADDLWRTPVGSHVNVVCLGLATLSIAGRGQPEPRHPLYMRKDLEPQPYRRPL